MSIFKRLVGGAAQAGAAISMKYVDDEIATNRAKMLEQLRVSSHKAMTDYELSDDVQGKRTAAEAARERTVGAARNETALAGARATANDTELTTGLAGRESILSKARATAEQDATKAAGGDAALLKAKRALALAGHIESSASTAQAELARLQATDLKRLGKLYDDAVAIQNDDTLTQPEKEKRLKPITTTIVAIKSKSGTGAARDPDAGFETVTEITRDKSGEETGRRVRKVPVRGGQESDKADPFAVPGAKPGGGADPYAKPAAKPAAGGSVAGKTTGAVIDRPAGAAPLEETKTPDGKTMYRIAGSQQWYGSKSEARMAQYKQPREVVDTGGFEPGY